MFDRTECENADRIPNDPSDARSALAQLHVHVDLMGMRVDQNLERMRNSLRGEPAPAATVRVGHELDALNASLIERCYLLLGRVGAASDPRFVVSALGVIAELHRVGHLALGVIKLTPGDPGPTRSHPVWDVVLTAADETVELFRTSLRAWSSQDLGLAAEVATSNRGLDLYIGRLIIEVQRLDGPEAERIAMGAFVAGRALDRIADHSATIGRRLQHLLTGDPAHLASAMKGGAP